MGGYGTVSLRREAASAGKSTCHPSRGNKSAILPFVKLIWTIAVATNALIIVMLKRLQGEVTGVWERLYT